MTRGQTNAGQRWVWVVLVGGLIAGAGSLCSLAVLRPDQFAVATDVYASAGRALLDGEAVYAVSPPAHPGFSFRYPPVIAVLAALYGAIGPTAAYVVQTAINLLALGVLARAVTDRLALDGFDRALAGLAILATGPTASAIAMGQVSPIVAVCVVGGVGVALAGRAGPAGLGFGLAAFLKVYPGGTWAWLVAGRRWRALAVAIGVLAVGWLANLAVGVDLTQTYVTTVLLEESSTGVFADGPPLRPAYVTVMRPLAAVGLRGPWLWVGAAAIVGPLVLASYRRLDDPVGAEIAALATVIGLLAVVPLEWFYFTMAVPLVVLVAVRLEGHPAIRPFALGALLLWLAIPPGPLAAIAPALPAGLDAVAAWLAKAVVRRVQPPLVGAILVLLACAWAQNDRASDGGRASQNDRTSDSDRDGRPNGADRAAPPTDTDPATGPGGRP